jgi:FdrA protein
MSEPRIHNLLGSGIHAINIGVKDFAANLDVQSVPVLHIDWRPPAEGDKEMMGLLDRLL